MTTSTDNPSTTTVSEPTSSDGPSPRRGATKKDGKAKKRKGRGGDRGAGLLSLPVDAFKFPKDLRLPRSSASESDPGPTPSTSVDSGPSSGDISFSQTTKRNTAKNSQTLSGGKLVNGNKKELSPPKKSKDKAVADQQSPRKKGKVKSPKGQEASPLKKSKGKVILEPESPRKKAKETVFVDEGLQIKKGKEQIVILEESPRKKVKEKVFADEGLQLKKGKDQIVILEESPRKKKKKAKVPKDETSPRKVKISEDEESLRKKVKDEVPRIDESPRKVKTAKDEGSPRKKGKDKLLKDEESPRKKKKGKLPKDEESPRKIDIVPMEEESPRRKPKKKVPKQEMSPPKMVKDETVQEVGSPRMKPKEKATKAKSSAGKKSKKKIQADSEEESSLPPEKPEKPKKSKKPKKVISDSEDSGSKPVEDKPSPSKFVVYLGDKDSSSNYDSRRAASSTSLTDASYDLARFYLQCKERQKRRARQDGGSQRSDTYLILDKCCRCGAGSEMVGEITGKLPACHYCLEEMGISRRRPPPRTRSFRVVDRTYDTSDVSDLLSEPAYSRSACNTEVSELRRYCDPSDKVFLCGSSVAVDAPGKYDVLPEDNYDQSWGGARAFERPEGLQRRRSFYSHPRVPAEPDLPDRPEIRVRAHISRERHSRNRGLRRGSPRVFDAPSELQRPGKSARNYGRYEALDRQSPISGDVRDGGWQSDYHPSEEETWRYKGARGSPDPMRPKQRHRRERKGQGRGFMQPERERDQEKEECKTDTPRDLSEDALLEGSPADESTNEVPSGNVGAGSARAKEPEPAEVAQEAWERYARDYKRFQENLAEWKYEQEKAHRRRLRDGGDDRPRRPVTPPRPNASMPNGFERGSHMGSEECKKDEDAMHIRIAVSPSRRSRMVVNEVTSSWTPGPFPPVGGEGWLPQAVQGLPVAPPGIPVAYQPTPLRSAPAARQLFLPPQQPPVAQPAATKRRAHSIPSPVSPMSPPTSGMCSPAAASELVPPAGPVPDA